MGRLREIPRTGAFAWSPSISKTLVATGTKAGALDADFSTETRLEIWDLQLGAPGVGELQPLVSAQTESRFHDIAWSAPSEEYPSGVIAGALENGALELWDAGKLIANASDAHITQTKVHTGAIKALQFNPSRPELLATCGARGELYITDLKNPSSPYRVGGNAVRSDDFDCLDWNKKVAHILVTGSSSGFVTVWDVKKKAENLTLTNFNRKPVSAVAWHPDEPTKLATATSTDQEPLIHIWQLKNSSQPEKVFKGHDSGLLSLSWCLQDSSLLLSCGKDNRNICWNTTTTQPLGEFPIVTNWTFQTRFNPVHPDMLATASFDDKIVVQSLQSVQTTAEKSSVVDQSVDGADFFDQAQTQPVGSTFTLSQAPKWLRRPAGASFGFGGKLVRFTSDGGSKSNVSISTFLTDTSVATSVNDFGSTLADSDVSQICDSHIESDPSDDAKEDWKVIKTLVAERPRKEILTYLGFEETKAVATEEVPEASEKPTADANGDSSFFDGDGEEKNFLTDLAASKGTRTNKPFNIFNGTESDSDKAITRNLMLGKFEDALDICLKESRMSDAFMIAICGGQTCIDKAQAAYLAQQTGAPNYLRLLASVVGKNLWDVVYNADLENWQEVMATLCTFADETEFPDLCEALGDRLESSDAPQKHASFCFLAGSKLEKLVPIWIKDMKASESAKASSSSDESAFAIHVQALQSFIEKISIFRKATKYEDKDGVEKMADWKLEPLYEKYAEYADVVASLGRLDLAEQFLSLLPAKYPAAEVARSRIQQATRKAVPSLNTSKARTAAAPVVPGVIPASTTPVATSSTSRYAAPHGAPTQPTGPSNVYAPPNAFSAASQPAPLGGPGVRQTGLNSYAPPMPNFSQAAASTPPPPSGMSAPPTGPPTAGRPPVNGSNWNDLPDTFNARNTPRRSTPAYPSPFPNSSGPGPYGAPVVPPPISRGASPALPPPPKAGAPIRTASPMVGGGADPSARPPSANPYAPQTPINQYSQPPQPASLPARVASPYQPPPGASTGAASSRYAPAAGMVTTPAPGPSNYAGGRPPVAPNPYAPSGGFQPGPGAPPAGMPPAAAAAPPPPPAAARPPPGPPPMGPPRSGPPRQMAGSPAAAPAPAAQQSYPPGDRSHIPPNSQPIFDSLDREMQRIKGLAPAAYKPQVDDTEKRLNILFDALNSSALPEETLELLRQITQAVMSRDFATAQGQFDTLIKSVQQGTVWVVGIKRLISMSKATPT